MRRRLHNAVLILAAVAAFFAFAAPSYAQTGEEIPSFSADITVRADGIVTVVERIDYHFPTPRHGIFRDIPVDYDVDGQRMRVPVSVTSVVDAQGRPYRYEIIRAGAYLRVKIGDPNTTVTGTQTYVISYTADGALGYFDDHDELYWNVTGDQWSVPIRRVSASVGLPVGIETADIKTECYTGPTGSTAKECVSGVQGRSAQFAANDFLTVVVGWPPGVVAKREMKPAAAPWTPPALPPWLPLLMPLLTLAGLYAYWWKHGRDPEGRGTLVPEYDPPDGLLPAEVGVLIDERAELKDVSATIVDLAVRGYLKIREIETKGLLLTSKDHEFEKLKDSDDPALKDYEREIMRTLFMTASTVKLSKLKAMYAFEDRLPAIFTGMYDEVVKLGYFPANPDKVRNGFIAMGIIGGIVASMIGFVLAAVYPAMVKTGPYSGVAVGILFVVFGRFMPKKTPQGTAALEHAWGFEEYLSRAERYRLEWQEREGIFERFLPYAMVYGVADKWAKAFEGLDMKQPDWYEGSSFRPGAFQAAAFVSSFDSLNASMRAAVAAKEPPKSSGGSGFSSGGGGGGSSGGGRGGGGGGSW